LPLKKSGVDVNPLIRGLDNGEMDKLNYLMLLRNSARGS